MDELPASWDEATLSEIAQLNPGVDKSDIDANAMVNFVSMPAVAPETGKIDVSELRPFSSTKSGYTAFLTGDVLFAKITPCMENGKMAVVPILSKTYGFGSTEFHVLRPYAGMDASYIYHFVSSLRFRADAEHEMTGAVGQKRVPVRYLSECIIPLPPVNEQRRITEKVERLFAELDRGVESLRRAKERLNLYRQSVLKHAFEGHLTADWRAKNPDKLEDPETLLSSIKVERERLYETALAEWRKAVQKWKESGEGGRRPRKPNQPIWPEPPNFASLRPLPKSWRYASFEAIAHSIRNGISAKPDGTGELKIFRISAVRPMSFDLSDYRRISDKTGKLQAYRLKYGDLLFSRYNGSRAYVGVSALYRGDGSHVYPDKLIRCAITSEFIDAGYMEKATNCGESRSHLEKRIRTTAGQSGISGTDLKTMPVPLCSIEEQKEIARLLDSKITKIDALSHEIETQLARAQSLRQSILKQAFSGKLVPQDPDDEPASVLLERIKAEKSARLAEQKPRRRSARKKATA